MPLGPFPLPEFDTPQRPARGPSRPWARMRTRWRRTQLDEELSAGADPRASEELSVRASQLRSEPVRARLANTLVYRKGDLRHALRSARMALDERAPGGRQLQRAA